MKLRNLLIASASLLLVQLTAYAQRPELVVQSGHSRAVQSAAFTTDGRLLATASGDDNSVRIWEVGTGRELRAMPAVNAADYVAFSPDGGTFYGGGTLRLVAWDVRKGKELRRFAEDSGGRYSALSEDGRLLATSSLQGITIWDTASGNEVHEIEINKRFYSALAFSSDGKTLAAGNQSADGIIDLWDVASGALIRSIRGAHSANVTALAFGADGRILVSSAGDNVTKVWDLSRGKAFHVFKSKYNLAGFTLSPDRKTVMTCDGEGVELRDIETGRSVARVRRPSCSLALFHPGGRDILVGDAERLTLLSRDGWQEMQVFRGRASDVTSVAFSPDGKAISSGLSTAESVVPKAGTRVWSADAGREFRALKCRTGERGAIAFSPNGRRLACGSGVQFDNTINLWDIRTGDAVRAFAGHTHNGAVAFSPDGSVLASAGRADGEAIKLLDVGTGRLLRQLAGTPGEIAFSPDGKHIVGGWGNSIAIWDVRSGLELRKLTTAGSPITISPNDRILAAAHNVEVKLFDMGTGASLRTLEQTAMVTALAFSHDGMILASGAWDGSIKLWKMADGTLAHTLSGHSNVVNDLAFSPDGKMLLSGGRDTKTTLWDVATGRELLTMIALDAEDWLAVTPEGLFDGTPAAWRQILWRFAGDTLDVVPVEAYFNEFFYPGLLTDILSGQRPHAAQSIAQRDRRQPKIRLSTAEGRAAERGPTIAREISLSIRISEHPSDETRRAGVGARDVRLFRNGSLVKVWRGDVLGEKPSVALEATVPIVAGENRFTAYTFNRDNVKSEDATLVVTGADSIKRAGAAYILAIGVNTYANAAYNLKYAAADAKDFGEEVRKQLTQLGGYERVEVVSLHDAEATKANILAALKLLAGSEGPPPAGAPKSFAQLKLAQPEDAVVIYFAGHGTAHGKRFYLIPHDLGYASARDVLDETGLNSMLAHSVSDEELQSAVEGLDAAHLLLVIDACNSGQALDAEERRRGPMNSKGLAQLAYEKGIYVLTASQSYQLANETPRLGHGFLTYALVDEGLKKAAADIEPADGQILVREWFDFAAERVPRIHEEQMMLVDSIGSLKLGSGGDRGIRLVKLAKDDVQRPRVFYRRELETTPMVVAKPTQTNRP